MKPDSKKRNARGTTASTWYRNPNLHAQPPSGQGARVRARAASGAGHRAPASERSRGLGRSPSWIDGKRAGRIAFDASVRMKIHEYQAKSILARHGVPV